MLSPKSWMKKRMLSNLFTSRRKSNHTVLKIIGGVALAAVAAGVIATLPDIKRYIRISTM